MNQDNNIIIEEVRAFASSDLLEEADLALMNKNAEEILSFIYKAEDIPEDKKGILISKSMLLIKKLKEYGKLVEHIRIKDQNRVI